MPELSLVEYVVANEKRIAVSRNRDSMFMCTWIGHQGYLHSFELLTDLEASPAAMAQILTELSEVGFVAYQRRPNGIFDAWVVTEEGYHVLESSGFVDPELRRNKVAPSLLKNVKDALKAHARFGKQARSMDYVRLLLEKVRPERQERLAFAVCWEPIRGDDCRTLLAPSEADVPMLIEGTLRAARDVGELARAGSIDQCAGTPDWKALMDHISGREESVVAGREKLFATTLSGGLHTHTEPVGRSQTMAKNPPEKSKAKSSAGEGFGTGAEFLTLLRTVIENDEVRDLLVEIREVQQAPDANLTIRARRVVGEMLSHICYPEMVAPIAQALSEFQDSCEAKLDALAGKLRDHGRQIETLIDDRIDVDSLMEPGPLKDRFDKEYRVEKEAMAKYLAEVFFQDKVHCFVQASTTILHLAEVLRNARLGRNSVFHTNSTFFPYVMLGRDSVYKVYTLCGEIHDPLCCGWLYGSDNSRAEEYLRDLFHREQAPVQIVFVTPQYMTMDGVLYFAREDTSRLVEALCQESPWAVILTPGPRLYESEDSLPPSNQGIWYRVDINSIDRKGRQLDLVIGGKMDKLEDEQEKILKFTCDFPASACHFQNERGDWTRVPKLE